MVTRVLSGGDKLEAHLAKLAKKVTSGASVRVGFLEGATYPDGTPVAAIAAIQNFGAPRVGIPPRPFFSNMIAEHGGEWGDDIAELLRRTGFDARAALELEGEHIEGQLRDAIIDGDFQPNSPVTNLLKYRFPTGGQTFEDVLQARSDVDAGVTAPAGKPLEQSRFMLGSIDSEVE